MWEVRKPQSIYSSALNSKVPTYWSEAYPLIDSDAPLSDLLAPCDLESGGWKAKFPSAWAGVFWRADLSLRTSQPKIQHYMFNIKTVSQYSWSKRYLSTSPGTSWPFGKGWSPSSNASMIHWSAKEIIFSMNAMLFFPERCTSRISSGFVFYKLMIDIYLPWWLEIMRFPDILSFTRWPRSSQRFSSSIGSPPDAGTVFSKS